VRQIARLTEAELDWTALQATYAGRGSRPHRPDLLLKLVIYEHAQGRVQPVQWFRDLHENLAVQWLTFGMSPSLTTLYEFRDRVQPLLEELNQQVIRTAVAQGHTDGSSAALDGTTVAANATRHRMIHLATVQKRLQILDQEIAALQRGEDIIPTTEVPEPRASASAPTSAATITTLPSAEASDAKPQAWKAKTLTGKRRQRDQYRCARDVLQAMHAANTRRRKDKQKQLGKIRVAPGDPMAPFGLDKRKTYRPLYNVQTMSDVQTDLVLAYATTRTVADNGQLLPMIERTMKMTGRWLSWVLVDSGYPSGADLAACQAKGVTVYAPWNENSFTETKRAQKKDKAQIPKDQFVFDPSTASYRCPEGKLLTYRQRSQQQKANGDYFIIEIYQADPADCAGCPLRASCVRSRRGARTVRRQEHEDQIEALKERMKQADARVKYRKRGCTVERRFADLKTHRGLERFSGRSPARADAQVGLTVLAHNLRTLEKLRIEQRQLASLGKTAS
jgi:transposase